MKKSTILVLLPALLASCTTKVEPTKEKERLTVVEFFKALDIANLTPKEKKRFEYALDDYGYVNKDESEVDPAPVALATVDPAAAHNEENPKD
ncbi:hypothetical protein [Candidatus Liberibacter sp.]|uniref:hypothetical protein n=1 Tax=Candidatus Liberibacter sp. TaxID=34022 RepID=UPI0015F47C0C|nr:hypothetical protein [Candidatus Liberibacter sp.]MBA5724493.1 hypothetical protein [Candidatus Liberibacter sp.]